MASSPAQRRSDSLVAFAGAPRLSAGEWHDVQAAVRAVGGFDCPKAPLPDLLHGGPFRRGLARIGHIVPQWRRTGAKPIDPALQPLSDFLCESARHGPAAGAMAAQLQDQGFTSAQIAALSFIVG